MSEEPSKQNTFFWVVVGIAVMLAWLATIIVLFPIGNPIRTMGSVLGYGVVYSSIAGVVITLLVLLFYTARAAIYDVMKSFFDDLGIDIELVLRDCKRMLRDEYLVITGKRQRPSDHHDDEDTV